MCCRHNGLKIAKESYVTSFSQSKQLYFKYELQVVQFFMQNPKFCNFVTANCKS